MEKRRHYWNGRWGRLARVDIVAFEDAGRWLVEHRIGGVEGRVTVMEFDREEAALDHIRALCAGDDDWRSL
jgi:hypothetical protein